MKSNWIITAAIVPFAVACAFGSAPRVHPPIRVSPAMRRGIRCDWNSTYCADVWTHKNSWGYYSGHDEPALLFYSKTPGSGNHMVYELTIPTEPPTPPDQGGTGGTYNFQLQPIFWIGMAVCDTQSAPNYTHVCIPDSDANIFNGANPAASHYIGHHPGSAYMELQFIPPGWATSCSSVVWCVDLTVDSLSFDSAASEFNNQACRDTLGDEPVNNTLLTFDGIPVFPANPLRIPYGTSVYDLNEIFFMFPGDQVLVSFNDTPQGLRAAIFDLTEGYAGYMTAGPQSGFAQVLFNPQGNGCTLRPYAFHPMYSTSSRATRVTWAAHSFNVAFSGELGHFEYCSIVDQNGNCTSGDAGLDQNGNPSPTADADDQDCVVPGSPLLPQGFVQIGGCIFNDLDFDGVSYGPNWPGTESPASSDSEIHAAPIQFTSPLFTDHSGNLRNYSRVAFETNLPGLETQSTPACDTTSGTNCIDPPPGAAFYPIFSTADVGGQCVWQIGGALIPGTTNAFGGNAQAEYGPATGFLYPVPGGQMSALSYQDFHNTLHSNPCPVNLAAPQAAAARTSLSPHGF